MLLDYRSHRRWIWFTLLLAAAATAVYCHEAVTAPNGPTGGSVVGLGFGVAGSLCMAFAGLLAALRRVPSWWWVGSRQFWLKGHLWLGSLSGLLILFHSHFRLGGPLEQALVLVLVLVLVSGVVGLVLQNVLPRALTARVPAEVPFEQIPHQCLVLRGLADDLVDKVCGPETSKISPLRDAHEKVIRPFLSPQYLPSSPLARPAQAAAVFASLRGVPELASGKEVDQLERYCADRRQMGEQERLHHWLHVWLLAHIPLSALLLGLGVAHAVTALYY